MTRDTVRNVRHCATCDAKCKRKLPIVGCERIMVSEDLKGLGPVLACTRRIWFDQKHNVVEEWRQPTQDEYEALKDE